MRGSNVIGDVGHHGDPLVDVVVEQVGAELRIQNLAGKDHERHNQKNWERRR